MQSTSPIDEEDIEDTTIRKTGEVNNQLFAGIETKITPDKIYTDRTRHFPITYIKGHKYVFVLYCYDVHVIIIEPIKYSTGQDNRKHINSLQKHT